MEVSVETWTNYVTIHIITVKVIRSSTYQQLHMKRGNSLRALSNTYQHLYAIFLNVCLYLTQESMVMKKTIVCLFLHDITRHFLMVYCCHATVNLVQLLAIHVVPRAFNVVSTVRLKTKIRHKLVKKESRLKYVKIRRKLLTPWRYET